MRRIAAPALVALLVASPLASSTASACGCSDQSKYVPRIQIIGDSIPWGVGATAVASWREGVYFAAQAAGTPIRLVGTQSMAGVANGLAIDPFQECYPGAAIRGNLIEFPGAGFFFPDIVILDGGTNDIGILGDDAPTVAATYSQWLDATWAIRDQSKPWYQIVALTVLRRLDSFEPTVEALNALLPGVIASKSYASHVTLIDQHDAIVNPVVGVNMSDVVHPNDVGYGTYLAPLIWSGLRSVVMRARGP